MAHYQMDPASIASILEEANQQGAPRHMQDGITYKQATSLDNAGYHSWNQFNPATNQDTPADKVQGMFTEVDEWRKSPHYPFGPDASPVPGESLRVPPRCYSGGTAVWVKTR